MINTDLSTLKKQGDRLILSKPDTAIAYFSAVAARYSPDMSDEEKSVCAAAMNNLGYLHFYHKNDPVVSYSYLVRGMSVAEELGTKKLIANLSLNMANVFCTLDEYDSAIACYRRAIATGLESGQYEAVLTSLSNIVFLTCSQSLPPRKSAR